METGIKKNQYFCIENWCKVRERLVINIECSFEGEQDTEESTVDWNSEKHANPVMLIRNSGELWISTKSSDGRKIRSVIMKLTSAVGDIESMYLKYGIASFDPMKHDYSVDWKGDIRHDVITFTMTEIGADISFSVSQQESADRDKIEDTPKRETDFDEDDILGNIRADLSVLRLIETPEAGECVVNLESAEKNLLENGDRNSAEEVIERAEQIIVKYIDDSTKALHEYKKSII